jgi:8-oxo-dGTP pyrophosphatase MutT (NUDIX family)
MPAPSRTHFEVSAGGVVLRRSAAGGLEVALIGTRGSRRWGLPKGAVNEGESIADAALREVREETGLEAGIRATLKTIEYWFWWGEAGHKERHHKEVHFYLMEYRGGDTSQHDQEVDEVRWFPLDGAIETASYSTERAVLQEAQQMAAGF